MKIPNFIVHFARTVLALGVLVLAPSLLWAQAEGPAFVSARLVDFQRDELTPAMREAGIKDRRFSRVVLGGNTNTFVNFRPLDNYPPQGPNELAESMGQRNYDRMIARAQSLISSTEEFLYLYRDDLSFDSGR